MATTAPPQTVTIPAAGVYVLDPVSSSLTFQTRHMFGLGGVTGTFGIRSGEITVTDPVGTSSVHAVIDAGSFTTGAAPRDDKVRSAKFLDTANHPDISFRSTGLREVGDSWVLSGTLTVRGDTSPAELTVTGADTQDDVLTLSATTRIDRYAHGVTGMKGMAGRHLDLTFLVHARRA